MPWSPVTTRPPAGAVHHPIFARVYARLSVGMEREVADRCERFRFPETQVPSITAPHILGAAHRPAAGH